MIERNGEILTFPVIDNPATEEKECGFRLLLPLLANGEERNVGVMVRLDERKVREFGIATAEAELGIMLEAFREGHAAIPPDIFEDLRSAGEREVEALASRLGLASEATR